ncbi:hypothetical protein MC885_007488, partial [Smutsia gigantea]
MTVLDVIFMKVSRASEEDIWKFLNMVQVHAGRKHFIYREPRKLLTQDLESLEYCQVPARDPPCCAFLWGPVAHAENSKMKVLEFRRRSTKRSPVSFHRDMRKRGPEPELQLGLALCRSRYEFQGLTQQLLQPLLK